jgi:predicted nucleic-acid-binding protein
MAGNLIDTNVIIRYLVENPEDIQEKFKGVFSFFQKVEIGDIKIELTELVLFESFFVLTRLYKVPSKKAANILTKLVQFKGINLPNKKLITTCLTLIQETNIDLVDAYLISLSKEKGIKGIYSFDKDMVKCRLKKLEI